MASSVRTNTFASSISSSAASDESNTAAIVQILTERLRAWKHVSVDLKSYTETLIKIYNTRGKEYEDEVIKLLSRPLREGNHFSTAPGGVVDLFDSMRENSQRLVQEQYETAKTLKSTVLPIFDRLHTDIKKKVDDVDDGIGKTLKVVEKSRKEAQKQIEMLGKQAAAFDTNTRADATATTGVKFTVDEDPYIIHRHVRNRLYKLVTEHNNHRKDLLGVQNNLGEFETYFVKTIRTGVEELTNIVANEAIASSAHYRNVSATASGIQPSFEWKGFLEREGIQGSNLLVDASEPPEALETTEFANMAHRSVLPVLAGGLERQVASKRTMGFSKKYTPAYIVITPAGYLHQFAADEVTISSSAPSTSTPELSLYLPECTVPVDQPAPDQFSISGKDTSKRLGAIKLSGFITHDLIFKASSSTEAAKWLKVARSVAKGELNDMMAQASLSPTVSSPPALSAQIPVADEKGGVVTSPITPGPSGPPPYSPTGKSAVGPTTTTAAPPPLEMPAVNVAAPAPATTTAAVAPLSPAPAPAAVAAAQTATKTA